MEQPKTIDGLRLDLLATRYSPKAVVEVETQDSKDSVRDLKQKKAFRQRRRDNRKRHS